MNLRALLLAVAAFGVTSRAAVEPVAQYNLKGAGGSRDTLCPETLKDQAGPSPELVRHGTPKVMSSGPAERRMEYDSSIKFEAPDQCYSTAKNLVSGDHFLVEAWACASKGDDPGWHAVVANGHGGSGFLLAQNGARWTLLVGGVGGTDIGPVEPGVWTHLAVVKSGGVVSAWLNGRRVANQLPGVGGGADNFSIGATAPGREPFSGWIAEVRYARFKPGGFDPAADFLMDNQKLKSIQEEELGVRRRLVESVLKAPGVTVVAAFDEKPCPTDWLLQPPATPATVQVRPDPRGTSAQIMLSNGLVSRTFLLADNLGCVSFKRSDRDLEFVRAVKPEIRLRINGGGWLAVGGLTGMKDNAFITPEWFEHMESLPGAFRLTGVSAGPCVKPYEWQPKCNAPAGIPPGRRRACA
ncbi:MAG: LamG domain-containing protein [Kiritimatiellia bacterium]